MHRRAYQLGATGHTQLPKKLRASPLLPSPRSDPRPTLTGATSQFAKRLRHCHISAVAHPPRESIFLIVFASSMSRNLIHEIESVIARLQPIRLDVSQAEHHFRRELDNVHLGHLESARNLTHYLSLRGHDLRDLQHDLGRLGRTRLLNSPRQTRIAFPSGSNRCRNVGACRVRDAQQGAAYSFGPRFPLRCPCPHERAPD